MKICYTRIILLGLLGFALFATPIRASAQEPVAGVMPVQYLGEPTPPYYVPPPSLYAEHQRLVEQLRYAESQLHEARAYGQHKLAKRWAKEVKRLEHLLGALDRDAARQAQTFPPYVTPPVPGYPSSYAPAAVPYPPPPPAYAPQYPATEAPPPYSGYPVAAYPPWPYPAGAYPSAPAGSSPYGGDPLSGIVSSLLGPMFGSAGIH